MSDSSLVEQGLFVWWITAQAGGGTSILTTYEAIFDVKVSSLSSLKSPCNAQAKKSPSFTAQFNTYHMAGLTRRTHMEYFRIKCKGIISGLFVRKVSVFRHLRVPALKAQASKARKNLFYTFR